MSMFLCKLIYIWQYINQLKNSSAICVVSYVDSINLKASFDGSGNVTAMLYGSVKKFDGLSEKKISLSL